jgi:tetratricopeptide (TPR) repeat protein
MKLITTTAIALAAVLSAAPAAGEGQPATGQAAAQPKIQPSKKALKALVELQSAIDKNDTANIPAKVAAAQAVAETKEDRYLIGQLQLKHALAAKDNAAAAQAVDTVVNSGFNDAAANSKLYAGLGSLFYNAKQYPQAAAAFQKAVAVSPGNSEASVMLGETFVAQGQKAEAAAAFQRAIQASTAAGQKPDEKLMKRAVGVAYDAQSPAAVDLARQWVANYPSASSWSDAIAIYRNLNQPDVETLVDLLRLMQVTGSLNSGGQYAQFARALAEQNNFNEAQAVVDAGVAAKALSPTSGEYSDLFVALKKKPKATAADLAEATKTAQSGMALLRIGDRYYAMGDYAKAVELYRMSMGKPGVDTAIANLHIGMALARAGDKAGATTALNAVTGPRAEIAKFWLTYLNQKS